MTSSIVSDKDVGRRAESIREKASNSKKRVVTLTDSSAVSVKTEEANQVIDIDIKRLDEGKVYHVKYQGESYGVEKRPDGKIAFYEVLE